jgi:hypothetical protein
LELHANPEQLWRELGLSSAPCPVVMKHHHRVEIEVVVVFGSGDHLQFESKTLPGKRPGA